MVLLFSTSIQEDIFFRREEDGSSVFSTLLSERYLAYYNYLILTVYDLISNKIIVNETVESLLSAPFGYVGKMLLSKDNRVVVCSVGTGFYLANFPTFKVFYKCDYFEIINTTFCLIENDKYLVFICKVMEGDLSERGYKFSLRVTFHVLNMETLLFEEMKEVHLLQLTQ